MSKTLDLTLYIFTKLFFRDEQLHHLVADIFGAGLDTTITSLKWALLYLATYPEAQKLIKKEVQEHNFNNRLFMSKSELPKTSVNTPKNCTEIGLGPGNTHSRARKRSIVTQLRKRYIESG